MAIGLVVALFALFFANVVAGAFFNAAFLSDVAEMLLLGCTSIAFAAMTLKREAAEGRRPSRHD